MMMSEFEELTGIFPTDVLYHEIEEMYYASNLDKDDFCKKFKANENNMAHEARRRADMAVELVKQEYASKIGDLTKELLDRQAEIKRLQEVIEREQEWKDFRTDTEMLDKDYDDLCKNGRELTDEEAAEFVEDSFGFSARKVHIVHDIPVYQKNRHGALRRSDVIHRNPYIASTDWNYIRFEVCGFTYEVVNDSLYQI